MIYINALNQVLLSYGVQVGQRLFVIALAHREIEQNGELFIQLSPEIADGPNLTRYLPSST